MNYWLIKSEPSAYSIDDLAREGHTAWSGVRNYQARNFMRDSMKVGDVCLFYHSSTIPPGIVGIARVSKNSYPDFTAFDKKNPHFDPKSKKENPTWYMVDVGFVEKFTKMVTLDELKAEPRLVGMRVVARGSRLSVQPVSKKDFDLILRIFKNSRQ